MTDEIIKVQNDINNKNTISKQLNKNIGLPCRELPSLILIFNDGFKGLKSYTNLLLSYTPAGESAVQNNIFFSRYFPN